MLLGSSQWVQIAIWCDAPMLSCFLLSDEPQFCHVYSNRKDPRLTNPACHMAVGDLIDYCHALLLCPTTVLNRLQMVQNAALLPVFNQPKRRLPPLEESSSCPCYPSFTAFHAACVNTAIQAILIPCSLVVEWPHEHSQIMDSPLSPSKSLL